MNPLSHPVAITEILLLLAFAAFVGWLLARLLFAGRLRDLRAAIADERLALDECRQARHSSPKVQPSTVGEETDEASVLARIAARASQLNFTRIGFASTTEADDLKDIVGVGPFLEKKLHSLGIYTFRQIANFTPEDVDMVNEFIEFFPGRIERDDWVGQARVLHDTRYGRKADA
ncbi:hypothetical protein [Tellurirhabdus rosea]|uniref:hypothetical protein n=1 Tax=Tellurirhabdus rosea TaxID=2674997 RepID=UPI002258C04F|nr:hypothetical protein [Tellurirhabdus rosea]